MLASILLELLVGIPAFAVGFALAARKLHHYRIRGGVWVHKEDDTPTNGHSRFTVGARGKVNK